MGNILTYIREYGKYGLAERPFGEVDSLILSQLSYLDFRGTSAQGRGARLRALVPEFGAAFVSHTRLPEMNTELIFSAADSRRFGGAVVCRHVSVRDLRHEKQFSATCFLLEGGPLYAAMRGTDDTFVGWKEDLNLSFMPRGVPAQLDALAYLEAAAREHPGELIVGGHSKGGNLAAYAGIFASPETKGRLAAVYDHDGPGFMAEVFQTPEYLGIKRRMHKTMPQNAVVGLMLEEHGEFTLVKSTAFGLLQHDPFTWVVEDGQFLHLGEPTGFSEYADRTVSAWLATMDMDTRREFVDALYAVIRDTGAVTFADFRADVAGNLGRVISNIRSADPEVKRQVSRVIAGLLRISLGEMKEFIGERLPTLEELREKLEEKLPARRENNEK